MYLYKYISIISNMYVLYMIKNMLLFWRLARARHVILGVWHWKIGKNGKLSTMCWLARARHMILGVWYLKIRKNIKNMLWNHGYYNSWLVSIIMSRVRLRVKIMVARSNVCWQKLWIVARNAKTSRVYPELKKTVAKRDRSSLCMRN